MSIQLALNGLSFSAAGISGNFTDLSAGEFAGVFAGDGPVEVELLTARTMLVPREFFDAESAAEMLAANGMPLLPAERAVYSDTAADNMEHGRSEQGSALLNKQESVVGTVPGQAGILPEEPPRAQTAHDNSGQAFIGIMAASEEALSAVADKLGARARYTTPLLRTIQTSTPTVWMFRTAELLYIKVYNNGSLRFAEVVHAPGDADILYLIQRLAQEFKLKEYELRLAGENTKTLGKPLKRSFKRIVCE